MSCDWYSLCLALLIHHDLLTFNWLNSLYYCQCNDFQSYQLVLVNIFLLLSSRDDIVFKDPLNTFAGIDNYKRIFWALRLSGRIFFRAIWINIVSIWQPVENVIMIRWIVHGIPRVPWESHGRFDGTSEYKLDKNGKIYEHRVDNVALNTPTKFQVLPVEELIQLLGCPSTPKPTYFETSLSSGFSCLKFMLRLSWIKCYLAFYLVASRCAEKD